MGLHSKHPAVSEVVLPTSARSAVGDGGGDGPLPSVVESATPRLAVAQADLEAELLDGSAENANARARAIAGHRAPDTVDLPEARIRVEDNAAAHTGLVAAQADGPAGGPPETTKQAAKPERATPPRPAK
jgi:hypothetical protein